MSVDCRNTFNFRPGYEITRSPWAKGLLDSIHEVRIVRVQISKREHIIDIRDTAIFSYGFASFDYQIYNWTIIVPIHNFLCVIVTSLVSKKEKSSKSYLKIKKKGKIKGSIDLKIVKKFSIIFFDVRLQILSFANFSLKTFSNIAL